MKRLSIHLGVLFFVVGLYAVAMAAGSYGQYLTAADVEKVSGLKGVHEVPYNPKKGAGGDLNFAGPDGKLVVMVKFVSGDAFEKYRKNKGFFKAEVQGVGEAAFIGPPTGPETMLIFRKGDHCVTLSAFFNLFGPNPTTLTTAQLVELGKIVAARL